MLNKDELEKIVINSSNDLMQYRKKDLKDKYIVLNCVEMFPELGTLENCVVEGGGFMCYKLNKCKLINVKEIHAKDIKFSIFEDCERICCGEYDEEYSLTTSQFVRCGQIEVKEAKIEDCIFNNIKIIFTTQSDVENCLFMNCVCDDSSVVCMEDGNMSDCSFENMELREDAYLIEGYGDAWVENSVFLNIRTSREDMEIFSMKETKGFVFKKTTEYSFVDEETCSGLNLVIKTN